MTQPSPPDEPEGAPRIGYDDPAVAILGHYLKQESIFRVQQQAQKLMDNAKRGELPLDAKPDDQD